jgi:anti-anti-sigma factor
MQAQAQGSSLSIGPTPLGFVVRLRGKGTMNESVALQEFATHALGGPDATSLLVIDLTDCEYLDSTFLGGLALLHRRHNQSSPHRFQVFASADRRQKLLAATHLDRVLDLAQERPLVDVGALVELGRHNDTRELVRHVMESHRRLAELKGPDHREFAAIADRLAEELGEPVAGDDDPTVEYELNTGHAE